MYLIDVLNNEKHEYEIYYCSGYSNDNLRQRASVNIRPVPIKIMKYDEIYPNSIRSRWISNPKMVAMILDKDNNLTNKELKPNGSLKIFESLVQAVDYYNNSVDSVLCRIEAMKKRVSELKI